MLLLLPSHIAGVPGVDNCQCNGCWTLCCYSCCMVDTAMLQYDLAWQMEEVLAEEPDLD